MTNKQWIQAGMLMALMAVGGLAVVDSFEPKKFEQKVTMTLDHISSIRSWATTYANLTVTKDFSGVSIASISAKGITNLPIVGTGGASSAVAPFDKEMSFTVSPDGTNKKYIIGITQSNNTPMDDIQKQMFEDLINDWSKSMGGTVGGYTSSGANGDITITFAG